MGQATQQRVSWLAQSKLPGNLLVRAPIAAWPSSNGQETQEEVHPFQFGWVVDHVLLSLYLFWGLHSSPIHHYLLGNKPNTKYPNRLGRTLERMCVHATFKKSNKVNMIIQRREADTCKFAYCNKTTNAIIHSWKKGQVLSPCNYPTPLHPWEVVASILNLYSWPVETGS